MKGDPAVGLSEEKGEKSCTKLIAQDVSIILLLAFAIIHDQNRERERERVSLWRKSNI